MSINTTISLYTNEYISILNLIEYEFIKSHRRVYQILDTYLETQKNINRIKNCQIPLITYRN